MVATSPLRNDLSNLGPGSQIEMQQTSNAYQSSGMAWKPMNEYAGMNGLNGTVGNELSVGSSMASPSSGGAGGSGVGGGGVGSGGRQMHSNSFDQLINFTSDEEESFDQMSDQGGDDSTSSVGMDDSSRIQQL
jgi:hypothetical protein